VRNITVNFAAGRYTAARGFARWRAEDLQPPSRCDALKGYMITGGRVEEVFRKISEWGTATKVLVGVLAVVVLGLVAWAVVATVGGGGGANDRRAAQTRAAAARRLRAAETATTATATTDPLTAEVHETLGKLLSRLPMTTAGQETSRVSPPTGVAKPEPTKAVTITEILDQARNQGVLSDRAAEAATPTPSPTPRGTPTRSALIDISVEDHPTSPAR
jgi:hypothetical protein